MDSLSIIRGKVTSGKKRGKGLGFPTANINLHKKVAEGVHISIAAIGKKKYHALTFIGNAKTFNEKEIYAETYLLAFKGNLYGKWISVRLLKKLRGNKKFKSAGDLIRRMKKDRQQAEKYFKI